MRVRLTLAATAAVVLSACADTDVTAPPSDGLNSGPSFAISDASNGGAVEGFWFLPPIAKQVTTSGTFDGARSPSMRVCELAGNPSAFAPGGDPTVQCVEPLVIVTQFAAGSATVNAGASYQFSWDTSPGAANNLAPMDPAKFYRIIISESGVDLGFLDVNPQQPSGQTPGLDYEDLYAFRLGENLPVKFFLNYQARCSLEGQEGFVVQCVAEGIISQAGGIVSLEATEEGFFKSSSVFAPNSLPGGITEIVVKMRRFDREAYIAETGVDCITGLGGVGSIDHPIFGDYCIEVTTDPVLEDPLLIDAFVDMCVDFNPTDYESIKFLEEQDRRLQIIRQSESGLTQALPNVDATTCDPILPEPGLTGFFPVPREDGFFRTAAITANRVAGLFAPEPLVAHGDIRLSGSTSGFSTFIWGIPGQMVKQAGDDVIIQQQEDGSESYDVGVEVLVVDAGTAAGDLPDYPDGLPPSALEGATVNFVGADGVVPGEVVTGANGVAAATWTVPSSGPGVFQMNATALGLLDSGVPSHEGAIAFEEEMVTFTATVVGLPSSATQSPPAGTELEGAPGETLLTPLTIRVVDENGEPVVGFAVTWTALCSAAAELCDGFVGSDTDGDPSNDDGSHLVTDENGEATGYWTLATVPGGNTLLVTVGSQQLNFLAGTWTAFGGCEITVDGNRATVDGEWDCALDAGNRLEFEANISGGAVPAEVRWQTDADSIYFLVLVQQGSLDKINSLRIDFDNTLNGPTADDDAIGYDASTGFYDQYLGEKCVNRNQAGCGLPDTNGVDGAGRLANDGTYSVYELSHPLAGDGIQDINVSSGDAFGFFLTLQMGNGAQGNTQVPGFRSPIETEAN